MGGNTMAEPVTSASPLGWAEQHGDQLRVDLAALRLRFQMLDDVDLKTSELVGRLAETMQSLVELRAKTSLDISAALERIEARIDAQEAQQRALLHGLRDEIASAQRSVSGLAQLAATIESSQRTLQARIVQRRNPIPEASAPPPPTPLFPTVAEDERAVPAASPPASTNVLRFDNVESPATALSLQRFVSRMPGVAAVTGRQYVGRTLRLDINVRGDVFYDDLLDWPGGKLALRQATEHGAVLMVEGPRGA
jgi:hypothetical protein